MKFKDFLKMWRDDPQVEALLEVEKTEQKDGIIDFLFHVMLRSAKDDYGRHEALRVRVGKNKEVIEHDVFNILGQEFGNKDAGKNPVDSQNWTMAVQNWYQGWSTSYGSTTGCTTNLYVYGSTGDSSIYGV